MARAFKGVINTDIRDSTPDWEPYIPPKAPEEVEVSIGDDQYLDLEKEAPAALARE
jgi:hypothetical protein